VILYDDSDGWYDHQMGPIVTQSQTSLDALTGTGMCGSNAAKVPTTDGGAPEQARCGVGPRQPLLIVSPWAKRNFVDGNETTQASVVQFIEDNWLGGARIGDGSDDGFTGSLNGMFDFARPDAGPLFLDPTSGEPVSASAARAQRKRK
jgi:phospholipase C